MLKIALTGGAGSGKSTVAQMFRDLGAPVLDADQIARQVVAPGQPAWQELRRTFGPEFFQADGRLDRAALARRIFSDPEARARVNAIVHPRVTREMARRLTEMAAQDVKLVIVEVPLLFEMGLSHAYHKIIVVYAEPEDQVRRLKARDSREALEISGLLSAQLPLASKRDQADYVVNNRGSLPDTRQQVKHIWQDLKNHLDKCPQKR